MKLVLSNLSLHKDPPDKRRGKCNDEFEQHLPEAAVMLAYAMHLFSKGAELVAIHPDGEHGKRFEIIAWLTAHGFSCTANWGSTSYGGRYSNGSKTLEIYVKPGQGDVVAMLGNRVIVAECKGGIINTRHAGQVSRLRKGLHEAVGQLLTRPAEGETNIAVVPNTKATRDLAERMAPRSNKAGIAIALVSENGTTEYIGDNPVE